MTDNSPRNHRFSPAIRTAAPSAAIYTDPAYRAGDTVMHPSEGVCRIESITEMALGCAQKRSYYILKPATEKSSSTVYMPVSRGNDVLRRLLSREDILDLIHKSREYASLYIADSKQRKDAFVRILSEGNHAKVIRMIQEIHEDRIRRESEGKKPCASDEAILAQAERLLHQEFSFVLHMSLPETAVFIQKELGLRDD